MEREALLADAARELGYPNLTGYVRRALNKALNAENNAGRLRIDWERVWRPNKQWAGCTLPGSLDSWRTL